MSNDHDTFADVQVEKRGYRGAAMDRFTSRQAEFIVSDQCSDATTINDGGVCTVMAFDKFKTTRVLSYVSDWETYRSMILQARAAWVRKSGGGRKERVQYVGRETDRQIEYMMSMGGMHERRPRSRETGILCPCCENTVHIFHGEADYCHSCGAGLSVAGASVTIFSEPKKALETA